MGIFDRFRGSEEEVPQDEPAPQPEPQPLPSNRRQAERCADEATTYLQYANGNYTQARLLDVSTTGARFYTRASLGANQKVACRLQVRNTSVQVRFEVCWKRSTPEGYEYGVRYLPQPATEKRVLGMGGHAADLPKPPQRSESERTSPRYEDPLAEYFNDLYRHTQYRFVP